ncbi:MAG: hypothetical protein C4313_01640 [Thermoflexus sp.]|uniref:SCP2 sterol-binding domain-containing protein n=1 Tax=Thermoflexus sp. TaxID=1969742 RepID=UPI00331C3935
MGFPFPSDAWIKALMEEVNRSPSYAEAAKNWEGDFYFVVEPEGPLARPVVLYMDLWHGRCREAFEVTDESVKNPAYRMSAPYSVWKQVIQGKLDPIQALVTGRIKLKGNMVNIMRNVRAAKELVLCCTRVPTEFIA